MSKIEEKLENLKNNLKSLKSAVLAFSAGVDSTFLLSVSYEILGNNLLAVIAKSPTFPERELNEGICFCKTNGIRYEVLELNELEIEGFKNNPKNRCYFCKSNLFKHIKEIAKKYGIQNIIEGSNLDDTGDYRPGRIAIAELGILSPLLEAKLTKAEIRILSKERGLKTWNKPSFACLSSRFPYGDVITEEKLKMVERAEDLLFNLGFCQYRVRIHGLLARIEIDDKDFEKILDKKIRTKITEELKKLGFSYTALDLTGYRTGSMNEVLNK